MIRIIVQTTVIDGRSFTIQTRQSPNVDRERMRVTTDETIAPIMRRFRPGSRLATAEERFDLWARKGRAPWVTP